MQNTIDTISNSRLPIDILDQIHNLIDLEYQSYYDLDREQKISLLESYLDDKGISILDIQCDLDIKLFLNKNITLDNMINQLFDPIDAAYAESINELFICARGDREFPAEQWSDYQPTDSR